jgi:hypothetical protein
MPGVKRAQDQILEHRAKVALLHNQGWSNVEIADELGIPKWTVCRDLAAVRANWQESALENISQAKKDELAKIDMIEKEAWEQWERSKEPRNTQTVTKGETVNKQSLKQEERGGDPRYMTIIQWCSEQRTKILGIVVQKVAPVTPDGESSYTLRVDDMTDLLKQVQAHKEAMSGSSS